MALDDKFDDIKKLIDAGKEKGYLTYDQVNDLIPHDVHSPEDLEDLLTIQKLFASHQVTMQGSGRCPMREFHDTGLGSRR